MPSANLGRRRWRAVVRHDETRVSTIDGSRDAAAPTRSTTVDFAGSRTPFQQVRERHESMTGRRLKRGQAPTRAAG